MASFCHQQVAFVNSLAMSADFKARLPPLYARMKKMRHIVSGIKLHSECKPVLLPMSWGTSELFKSLRRCACNLTCIVSKRLFERGSSSYCSRARRFRFIWFRFYTTLTICFLACTFWVRRVTQRYCYLLYVFVLHWQCLEGKHDSAAPAAAAAEGA